MLECVFRIIENSFFFFEQNLLIFVQDLLIHFSPTDVVNFPSVIIIPCVLVFGKLFCKNFMVVFL